MRSGYVYILASRRNGTLYVGVTSDLIARVYQHRNDVHDGFSKEHAVHRLVYYEAHNRIDDAIAREKAMKKWNRAWKLGVIETNNPQWLDLYDEITG